MTGTAGQITQVDSGGALAFAEAPKPASSYETVWVRSANAAPAANGTFMLLLSSYVGLNSAGSSLAAFYLDPADMATVPGKSKFVRLRATVVVNATAPAVNFAFHLYPAATWGGAAGSQPLIATVGTSVGSTTFTTPGASSQTTQVTADLAHPAAGIYAVALVTSGAIAANSNSSHIIELQRRWA